MYWLVFVLSISGVPEIDMEIKMGTYFSCSIAKQKFIDGNPPNIYIEGKFKKSNIDNIECVKK
tara:strand:- start:6868 stop:7056 length:189 start_codon:yes stop_codon:yes gene_type:complete